jgi:hypothetical protein
MEINHQKLQAFNRGQNSRTVTVDRLCHFSCPWGRHITGASYFTIFPESFLPIPLLIIFGYSQFETILNETEKIHAQDSVYICVLVSLSLLYLNTWEKQEREDLFWVVVSDVSVCGWLT